MNHPSTAVVILNWNGAALLRKYLPTVVKGTNPQIATVIVVDNGSTDNSRSVLETEFPHVRTIYFETNYGFADGYNRAISIIAPEFTYAVLLNSDVAVESGWLEPLVNFMDSHPDAGACQPKILSDTQRDTFEYAGAAGGFIDRHGYPYCRGRILGTCEKDNGQYNDAMPVFWASGAAFMVRTELYLAVGGLDPRFFAHMEEIDLCWRIHLAGAGIWAVPDSSVYHLGGGSLPAGNPRKTYLNFRNNLLMMHKNLPDSTRKHKLLVRRLLDTLAWARFAATGDWANARAVWRAHRDFRRMARDYTTHPTTDLLDTRTDTRRNILTDYYLRYRRTFR